jgi:hypothetical protein
MGRGLKGLSTLGLLSWPYVTEFFSPRFFHTSPLVWATYISLIAIVIAWFAARAWERSAGNVIAMGGVQFSKNYGALGSDFFGEFYVTIRNAGRNGVSPRLYLLDIHTDDLVAYGITSELAWLMDDNPTMDKRPQLDVRGAAGRGLVLAMKSDGHFYVPQLGRKPAHVGIAPEDKRAVYVIISANCGEPASGNTIERWFKILPLNEFGEFSITEVRHRMRIPSTTLVPAKMSDLYEYPRK